MRRRVARVVRRGLFVVGVVLLVWIPASLYRGLLLSYSGDVAAVDFTIQTGSIFTSWFLPATGSPLHDGAPGWVLWLEPRWDLVLFPSPTWDLDDHWEAALPFIYRHTDSRSTQYQVRFPLWLLAFICLAWPVTSFIIARRRHKRGFPVEPKGGGETVSTPVSSS